MTFATNLGTGGVLLDAQYGSTVAPNTNEPLLLTHTGENYLYLPGVAGNRASTPDSAALDITGDIDIRVRVAMDDWTPTGDAWLISKQIDGTTDRSFVFHVRSTGFLRLTYSTDGGGGVNATSSVVVGLVDGAETWLRSTVDVDNGAGGHTIKFFTSADGSTWTQLGTDVVVAGTISLFAGTGVLMVGGLNGSNSVMAGKVYRAQVLDGINGTTVFDADFTQGITSGAQTTFTESSVNAATVTINRSTAGRKSVAVVRPVWLLGTDDFFQVADNALLDFGAGDSFTVVAVVRQWATPTSFGRYVAKQTASVAAGYRLTASNTDLAGRFFMADGASSDEATTPTFSAGAVTVLSAVVDRSANSLTPYRNGTAGTPDASLAAGSLANAEAFRIGRASGATTSYQDFECLAVAVFRRALSASELATIATYYGTGELLTEQGGLLTTESSNPLTEG